MPIVAAKNLGEINTGDILIVGQPWRAVEVLDELTNSVSINIFCSEFVLKCPPDVSSRAHIESLPFFSYAAFTSRLVNSFSKTKIRQSSSETLSTIRSPPCVVASDSLGNHYSLEDEAVVLATAATIDFDSGICMRDFDFVVPVAILLFHGASCAALCYCVPGDFGSLVQKLVEKCRYAVKQVCKEADLHGDCYRSFIQSSSVQMISCSETNDDDCNNCFELGSRFRLKLQYFHQFSFQSRSDHILVAENGHGFGRFRFFDLPVYGCIIGSDCKGSLIPIFLTSRTVANLVFSYFSRKASELFVLDSSQQPFMIFELLSVVSNIANDTRPSVLIADAFTKFIISPTGHLTSDGVCLPRDVHLMNCCSNLFAIVDSFYNGGDHMCPKCQSSCSVVRQQFVCRHCGFSGSSELLSSGYLPLYLHVSDVDCSSHQVLQVRGYALSSFIAQYTSRCMSFNGHDPEENLKESILFCNSLIGKKVQCHTLAHAASDESIICYEKCPIWMSHAMTKQTLKEVIKISFQ